MTTEPRNAATIPAWDVADRMRKSLRTAAVSVADMADYLGVSRNAVSTWINGRVRPSTQTLRLWALRTGVPYEWLADIPDERTAPSMVNFTWRSHPQAERHLVRAA